MVVVYGVQISWNERGTILAEKPSLTIFRHFAVCNGSFFGVCLLTLNVDASRKVKAEKNLSKRAAIFFFVCLHLRNFAVRFEF